MQLSLYGLGWEKIPPVIREEKSWRKLRLLWVLALDKEKNAVRGRYKGDKQGRLSGKIIGHTTNGGIWFHSGREQKRI